MLIRKRLIEKLWKIYFIETRALPGFFVWIIDFEV